MDRIWVGLEFYLIMAGFDSLTICVTPNTACIADNVY